MVDLQAILDLAEVQVAGLVSDFGGVLLGAIEHEADLGDLAVGQGQLAQLDGRRLGLGQHQVNGLGDQQRLPLAVGVFLGVGRVVRGGLGLVIDVNLDAGDGDSVGNVCDNCATTANADQSNADGDLHGDACDNCAATANDDQANGDSDSQGDVCDNCAAITNEDQANQDGDIYGDVCDICPKDADNDSDSDGVCGDIDYCANTADSDTAAGVPSVKLGVNHFADTNGDGIFDTTLPKGKGPGLSFTIAQTAGCNCAQIIPILSLGEGHKKFGCSPSAMQDFLALLASLGFGG